MKDIQAHLEKLRTQIAECELIRDSATDKLTRETFGKLAVHFRILAAELDKSVATIVSPVDTFLVARRNNPFPQRMTSKPSWRPYYFGG